jgi:RNA polymerase sigma-70 factor (family 1)
LPANQPFDEKRLFLQIAEGDEAAFEQLFYLYLPRLQPIILKMVKQENVVNDIVQEVFLSIWIDRDKLPDIVSPTHWIFRLMYYRCLNWLKQQAAHKEKASKYQQKAQNGQLINGTEEAVLFAETASLVRQAILQLPVQTRNIYLLSREKGLKVPEIAAELGLAPQSVKNTLVRAGKSIRAYLVAHGIDIPLVILLLSHL